jgi:hypothetical protein
MSDARSRNLDRRAAAGDPAAAAAAVWAHVRTGRPFDERSALLATAIANKLKAPAAS